MRLVGRSVGWSVVGDGARESERVSNYELVNIG